MYNKTVSRKAHKKKSQLVKALRGASPEEVVNEGEYLRAVDNKNHLGQRIEIYWFRDYGWCVVVDIQTDRLITAYPSRKVKIRGDE